MCAEPGWRRERPAPRGGWPPGAGCTRRAPGGWCAPPAPCTTRAPGRWCATPASPRSRPVPTTATAAAAMVRPAGCGRRLPRGSSAPSTPRSRPRRWRRCGGWRMRGWWRRPSGSWSSRPASTTRRRSGTWAGTCATCGTPTRGSGWPRRSAGRRRPRSCTSVTGPAAGRGSAAGWTRRPPPRCARRWRRWPRRARPPTGPRTRAASAGARPTRWPSCCAATPAARPPRPAGTAPGPR